MATTPRPRGSNKHSLLNCICIKYSYFWKFSLSSCSEILTGNCSNLYSKRRHYSCYWTEYLFVEEVTLLQLFFKLSRPILPYTIFPHPSRDSFWLCQELKEWKYPFVCPSVKLNLCLNILLVLSQLSPSSPLSLSQLILRQIDGA